MPVGAEYGFQNNEQAFETDNSAPPALARLARSARPDLRPRLLPCADVVCCFLHPANLLSGLVGAAKATDYATAFDRFAMGWRGERSVVESHGAAGCSATPPVAVSVSQWVVDTSANWSSAEYIELLVAMRIDEMFSGVIKPYAALPLQAAGQLNASGMGESYWSSPPADCAYVGPLQAVLSLLGAPLWKQRLQAPTDPSPVRHNRAQAPRAG